MKVMFATVPKTTI